MAAGRKAATAAKMVEAFILEDWLLKRMWSERVTVGKEWKGSLKD
jgi:hypothetical protein